MNLLDQELEDTLQLVRYRRTGTWQRVRDVSDTDEHALRVAAEVARGRLNATTRDPELHPLDKDCGSQESPLGES